GQGYETHPGCTEGPSARTDGFMWDCLLSRTLNNINYSSPSTSRQLSAQPVL
ncbi:hypothetical protein ABG768_025614, partial [Culter alburnus]